MAGLVAPRAIMERISASRLHCGSDLRSKCEKVRLSPWPFAAIVTQLVTQHR